MKKQESIWARLTRLFRNGPVVRHRVASSSKMYEPQGTARAYKKELSSLYVNSLASYGQYERLARYADYSEMEYTPEISRALTVYADEVTNVDENGDMLRVESDDEALKDILETLFFDILNIEFNLHSWVRNLCKYGDFVLFVDASETNGILNLLPIPINEIEREEGYDPKNPFAFRFRWLTQGNMILEAWQIVHFRLLGNDNFLPYGSSVIEPARRIWRQLILIEDAMLVYRVIRSPERRVFKIEVGNVKPEDIPSYVEEVTNRLKRSKLINEDTGRVDLRYNPLSVDEDYILPQRDGKGSAIETLPGGQFTGDIEDVQYIQGKMFAALGIPKAYLSYEEGIGSKATLAQEDVRFSRTIQRIQKIVISELYKIAIIHLFLLGYEDEDLVDYQIKMANPSTIAEQQKLELWRMKLEVAGTAQEGMMDKETVWSDIFGWSDKKIEKVKDGMRVDKLFELELENMQLPDQESEMGGGEEMPAGAEDLPDTLGGAGEEPGPEGGEELEADWDREEHPGNEDDEDGLMTSMRPHLLNDEEEPVDEDISTVWTGSVAEKLAMMDEDGDDVEGYNPGSEGDEAEMSVDHGKDLFDPDEDLGAHVFGTEKQTASDPFDSRYMRRMVTRPFSESTGDMAGSDAMAEYVRRSKDRIDEGMRSLTDIMSEAKIKGKKHS